MSFIQVTSSELRNKAEQLQGLNSKLKSEIENLQAHQANLNTMWEGDAKEAFNNAFIRDKEKMDAFKTAIDQYIQAMLVIAGRYEEAEKKNISIASTRNY